MKILAAIRARKPEHRTFTEKQFLGIKTQMEETKKLSDKIADFLTNYFGTINFFSLNALFFLVWMLLNTGIFSGIPIFDPFPYGLLTMVVSLEAIFLSIFVLISQNRASEIAEIREEVDLVVNVRAEQEITKMLKMLDEIHHHLGLHVHNDQELKSMKQRMNLDEIRDELMSELHSNHHG